MSQENQPTKTAYSREDFRITKSAGPIMPVCASELHDTCMFPNRLLDVNCETCAVYDKCVCTLKYPKEAWGKPREAVKIRRMAWAEKDDSQKSS
jgi:hypothetical protein